MSDNQPTEDNKQSAIAVKVPMRRLLREIEAQAELESGRSVLVSLRRPFIAPDGIAYTAVFGTLIEDGASELVVGDGCTVRCARDHILTVFVTDAVNLRSANIYIADVIVDSEAS